MSSESLQSRGWEGTLQAPVETASSLFSDFSTTHSVRQQLWASVSQWSHYAKAASSALSYKHNFNKKAEFSSGSFIVFCIHAGFRGLEVAEVHSLKCGRCPIPLFHFENFGKIKSTRVFMYVWSLIYTFIVEIIPNSNLRQASNFIQLCCLQLAFIYPVLKTFSLLPTTQNIKCSEKFKSNVPCIVGS